MTITMNDLPNGTKVTLIGEGREIFTVTQSDDRRFWAADEDGRGWYCRPSDVSEIIRDEDDEDYDEDYDDDDDDTDFERQQDRADETLV